MDNAWFKWFKTFSNGLFVRLRIQPIEHTIFNIMFCSEEDNNFIVTLLFLQFLVRWSIKGKEINRETGISLTKGGFSICVWNDTMGSIHSHKGNWLQRFITDTKVNGFRYSIWFGNAISYNNVPLPNHTTTLKTVIFGNEATFVISYSQYSKMLFRKFKLKTEYCAHIDYSELNPFVYMEHGKGENGWDCGDEMITGCNFPLGEILRDISAEEVADKFSQHIKERHDRRGDAGYVKRPVYRREAENECVNNPACAVADTQG